MNMLPGAGVAVRVTIEPSANLDAWVVQVGPQEMATGRW